MISRELQKELLDREYEEFPTTQQRQSRWKTMCAAYRKVIDHNNTSGSDRIECEYFKEMRHIYGYKPNVQPIAIASSSGLSIHHLDWMKCQGKNILMTR